MTKFSLRIKPLIPLAPWKLVIAALLYVIITVIAIFGYLDRTRHDPGEPIEPVPPEAGNI